MEIWANVCKPSQNSCMRFDFYKKIAPKVKTFIFGGHGLIYFFSGRLGKNLGKFG